MEDHGFKDSRQQRNTEQSPPDFNRPHGVQEQQRKYPVHIEDGPSDLKQQQFGGGQSIQQFKGQDLEMYYMEKKLKPEVEKEIKKGFFEIRKKQFDENGIEQPEKEE